MSPLVQSKRQIHLPGGGSSGGSTDVTKERIIREGLETVPTPSDLSVIKFGVIQEETAPPAIEDVFVAAAFVLGETPTPAIDQLDIDINLGFTEVVPSSTVDITAIVTKAPIAVPVPTDAITLNVLGQRPPNAVILSSGITNPNNALDLDTDEATAVAAASGVGGTTSTTLNFDFQVNFADFAAQLSEITDITSAFAQAAWRITPAGTAPIGQTINVALAYRLDPTAAWTNIGAVRTAALARVLSSVGILPLVGDDWTKLDKFQMRCSGTIVSGTGVGASVTVGIENFRAAFTGTRSV